MLGGLLGQNQTVSLGTITTEINNIITIISTVCYSLIVAGLTVFAIYVGVKMARAEDDSKRKEAKNQLIYSIVGIVAGVAVITLFNLILPMMKTQLGNAGGTGNVNAMANSVITAIGTMLESLFKVALLIASLLACYVAWKLMSAEDESKRKQAKMQLIYCIVGVAGAVVINILASSMISFIFPTGGADLVK